MSANIILTSTSEHLKKSLKNKKGLRIIVSKLNKDKKRHFPDEEIYTRFPQLGTLKGKIVVVHSGMPHPNEGLVELAMTLEILKSTHKAFEIFFTYFPYGQQDNVFQNGEVNFAESLIKKYINYYGARKIYTLDAHFYGRSWVKKYPLKNISAVSLLKEEALKDFPALQFFAPDLGCQRRTGIDGVEKKRKNSFESKILSNRNIAKFIKGKDVGVIDDLLETGGTMSRFYDFCKTCGAKNIVALISHGVLPEGIQKIKNKYKKLYLINSINNSEANLDITSLIYNQIT